MTEEKLKAYLSFLSHYPDSNPLDYELLSRLQRRHMLVVPFENFDVFLKKPLRLDSDGIFEKVVMNGRGGYCFELNGLFGELLRAVGFSVRSVLARVWLHDPPEVPPRNHLANLVTIGDKDYLTDVGFGGYTSRVPLDIRNPEPINDGEGLIKVEKIGDYEYMLSRNSQDGWQRQYAFEDKPVYPSDLKTANFYMERHPDSHFVPHRFIGLFTEQGRKGLFNNQFSERIGQEIVRKKEITDGAAWLKCLREEFGMELHLSEEEMQRLSGI